MYEKLKVYILGGEALYKLAKEQDCITTNISVPPDSLKTAKDWAAFQGMRNCDEVWIETGSVENEYCACALLLGKQIVQMKVERV